MTRTLENVDADKIHKLFSFKNDPVFKSMHSSTSSERNGKGLVRQLPFLSASCVLCSLHVIDLSDFWGADVHLFATHTHSFLSRDKIYLRSADALLPRIKMDLALL